MDSLYEVSQINEVNREWAAQIWARIDSYMDRRRSRFTFR